MTVTVDQDAFASGTSPTVSASLAAGCATGNLIWVAAIAISATEPQVSYQINGAAARSPFSTVITTSGTVQLHESLWNAYGGEQFFIATFDLPLVACAIVVVTIADDAHLPPYDTDLAANSGTTPETSSWYAPDDGLVLGLVASAEFNTFVEPVGWSMIGGLGTDDLSFAVASRPETAGVQPAELWSPAVAGAWLTSVVPFNTLGRRLPPGTMYASNPAGMLKGQGRVEPPNPVDPFIPDVNPLPPLSDPIEVPLEPWIESPGPWREDV